MAVIFDSNVWIALFNENDAHHQKALQLFSNHSLINVPEYVILEITSVLQLRASKEKANLFAEMIHNTAELNVLYTTQHLFHESLKVFQTQDKKLSFVDCALLVLARNNRVYTFDTDLAQAINLLDLSHGRTIKTNH